MTRSCAAAALVLTGLTVFVGACTPARRSAPAPAPLPLPRSAETPRAERPVSLPTRLVSTTWRVRSLATIAIRGPGASSSEQRVESSGVVSWRFDRQPSGALKGAGQVDSFSVRPSFDATTPSIVPAMPAMPALLLLDAVVDSGVARVTTRPPLVNECDRPEAAAAALARELLVRIPDGVRRGQQWKDSTVSLICRSGVPLVIQTVTVSTLGRIDGERLVVAREIRSTLRGTGGSAFRALELSGTGQGSQRVEISPSRGTVERLEGTSTLSLQATERLPGSPARVQQVTQRVDIRAERP